MFIASEARAGVSDRPPAGQTGERSPQWYIVVTSLLVGFGGFVLPVVGWIAGLVMMWVSPSWRRWEKWVATMAAPVVALVVITVLLVLRASTLGSSGYLSGGPLLDWWTIAGAFFGVVPILTAVWLLWRGLRKRRGQAEARESEQLLAGMIWCCGGRTSAVVCRVCILRQLYTARIHR